MGYGQLGSVESFRSVSNLIRPGETAATATQGGSGRRRRYLLLGAFAILLLAASAATVGVLVRRGRARGLESSGIRAPTQAIAKTCGRTRYPDLCVSSLMDFPGATSAGERDLVHVSLNMTVRRVAAALYGASAINGVPMATLARSAYEDCMELLDDSLEYLSNSLYVVSPGSSSPSPSQARLIKGASDDDVINWLSAALTNQDTCEEGLQDVKDTYVKQQMADHLKDLSELVSNTLAIFAGSTDENKDFSGIPIQNKRKLLSSGASHDADQFPEWIGKKDRRLLQVPGASIQADMVVSQDGLNGTYKSIADAVKAVPDNSPRRIIIYIKAGRYVENIKVGRKKTNIMFVGDGKNMTVIGGSRSVFDSYTTFHSATFAATGAGVIIKDMTIENYAGPEKHQAVALRIGADHAVVYRCSIAGYQDTLYVHSQRQFYRECDIYGTVDFVFGNAAVVLQNCNLWARKPLAQQKNTITAQNRKDPNQNTGISIHACRVVATPELEAAAADYPTYLGRPWKTYARVVYMLSYMGGHVNPAGWLEWNGNFALDTLYYGEYMNYGPGAAVGQRVNWSGFRVITLPAEANKFTVGEFITGASWLPSTGVAFLSGLSAQ